MKKSTLFSQLLNRERSSIGNKLIQEETIFLPEELNNMKKVFDFENKPLAVRIASRLLFGNEKVVLKVLDKELYFLIRGSIIQKMKEVI